MIDVKQATEIARHHLIDILGKQEVANEKGITLEEFELAENGKYWSVTLGYPVREQRRKTIQEVPFLKEPRRKFKTFKIDTVGGRLLGMKYSVR